LASMLNSASTIFTMDIYHKVRRRASQSELVSVGRVCTLLFVLIAVCIAPNLGAPEFSGIFTFIQEFQGFISPGVLAIFVFGILVQKAPRVVGTVGLLMNPILYGALKIWAPQIAFLNRMAICMGAILLVLALITWLRPLKEPVELPVNDAISLEGSRGAKWAGWGVVLATIALYIIFW
jgi:SSS family solute:Na+ symporter